MNLRHTAERTWLTSPARRRWVGLLFPLLALMAACTSEPSNREPKARRLDPAQHPLVFSSGQLGSLDLWLTREDGSDPLQLTSAAGDEFQPTWVPDGSRIAFACRASEEVPTDVCVVRADGTGLQKLTDTPDLEESAPSWSPDGTRLLFDEAGDPAADMGTVRVMNVDGAGVRTLVKRGGFADWSPDGQHIAYTGPYHQNRSRLWVMDADGSHQRPLGPAPSRSMSESSWSPDGTRIAYVVFEGVASEDVAAWNENIGVMAADGTGARTVVTSPGNDHWQPAWSPDSARLLYAADGTEEKGEMRVVDLRTGTSKQLTDDDDYDLTPDWLLR
jgi:Tol biopolymer transport system component